MAFIIHFVKLKMMVRKLELYSAISVRLLIASGLLFKLKQAGIGSTLLQCLANYLLNRKQRVPIPVGSSDCLTIEAVVSQGSILAPLLFLIYIDDIVMHINLTVRLFADDTSLYLIVDDPVKAARCLNADLDLIHQWAERWLMIHRQIVNSSSIE